MSDAGAAMSDPPRPSWIRWLPALLVVSLALNLLVGGAIAVRFLAPDRIERFTGTRFSPLIPRSFLSSLPEERRNEFTAILNRNRSEFRDALAAMRGEASKFADALDAEPYDEARALAAIGEYGTRGSGLIQRGNAVTAELVRKLTPQERTLLAAKVRERTAQRSRRRD